MNGWEDLGGGDGPSHALSELIFQCLMKQLQISNLAMKKSCYITNLSQTIPSSLIFMQYVDAIVTHNSYHITSLLRC